MRSADRVVPALVLLGMAALLAAGVWLLRGTPGTLVNEAPPRLGPTAQSDSEPIIIVIEDGDSARDVADKLEDAEVIQSGRLFRVLTSLMGLGNELVSGEYEFERGGTALTAVRRISQGVTAGRVVTIREGLRAGEIGDLLERQGIVTADAFRQALDGSYTASFLAELPAGVGREGFLFPATYGFSRDATAEDVVRLLLDAFDQRYREHILPTLAAADGRSLLDVITLASIVEREAQVPAERPIIAGVFLNRLAIGLPLQADPTVQYALGNDPASVQQFGFWKRELTVADLAIDSPYNTYINVGLPPGPIANPGLDAIQAALTPEDNNFLFFVACADGSGSHVFAETLDEHNANVSSIESGACPT
ncbi:MAG: endolytic transglycosylase MltG [Chloroflexi bacterium]|nr:endolytic transglycosylase MltG [Chloroflexota bacterium]